MTKKLEVMKVSITNSLKMKQKLSAEANSMRAYYRGKIFGVLEAASGGILSRGEYEELHEHYLCEKARFE